MKEEKNMEIINTFVIPHLNNKKGLLRCLDTLYKYTPKNFRVILIDQSEDLTLYEELKDKVHLHVKAYRNLGFAKASNTGIKLADTKYVTVLNDDVEFIGPKWWGGIEETFKRWDETILACNPSSMKKLDGGGMPVDDVDFPYKENWTEEEYDAMIMKESNNNPERGVFVDGITPWCVIFDRERLLKVGLFDESYYPGGGEDYDLQNRAYWLGKMGKVKHYRFLGSSISMAYHQWCVTKVTQDAYKTYEDAKHLYQKKWGTEEHTNPYPNGTQGRPLEDLELPEFVIKEL